MKQFIPISKTKLRLLLSSSLVFVAGSLVMLLFNPYRVETIFSPAMVNTVAIIGLLFFGFAGWFIWRKMQDSKAGLQIDEQGIIDQSSGASLGRIRWKDIESVEEYLLVGQQFVTLKLRNPEHYIANSNMIIRKVHQANIKLCGTPAAITANTLQIDHAQLLSLLQQAFQHYRQTRA